MRLRCKRCGCWLGYTHQLSEQLQVLIDVQPCKRCLAKANTEGGKEIWQRLGMLRMVAPRILEKGFKLGRYR